MTPLPTTTSSTDNNGHGKAQRRRNALSLHSDSEKVLRIVFTVANPSSNILRRYYRAILQAPDGQFHLAGGHVIVDDGAYIEDTTDGSEPPFWVERDTGLRNALLAVNRFMPRHRGADTHINPQFLKGRTKCCALWRLMKDPNRRPA